MRIGIFLACCISIAGGGTQAVWGQEAKLAESELSARRQLYPLLELVPNRSGAWIFGVGSAPRIIWRDVDEVRRLGGDPEIRVRWFDARLEEHATPSQGGRWMAWVEGIAPSRTPLRRSLTLYAIPEKLESGFTPDLSVVLPNFPGPDAPAVLREHQIELSRMAKDFLIRGLLESEKGAILLAGLADSEALGRPRRYVESTSVINDAIQLKLKLRLLNLEGQVQPLAPPVESPSAGTLRMGSTDDAGVAPDARDRIEAFCREWAAATDEPFVTLVARRGVVVMHEAFGVDSQQVPIPRDYRCWIASLTKTVTGILFARFLDQGRVQLDDSLSVVFPDYPPLGAHVPTFRQCLNHTSGLSGHGEFGGIKNPHLENLVLNALDINQPGQAHVYSGLGFELVAKAMEILSGQPAARLYDESLFQPLGFGDVVLGNASSDAELTAWELGVLGQLLGQRGEYGGRRYFSEATWESLLPRPLNVPGATVEHGVGLHWIYHRRVGASPDSQRPEDLLFSARCLGHGSFSGCILMVDLEQELVIAQARREFRESDNEWYARFFQVVAETCSRPAGRANSPLPR